jgi:hypothetical protein
MTKRIRIQSTRHSLAPYRGKHDDGRHSSRVVSGKDLLPNEDGRSRWARLLRSTMQAMIAHCGPRISDTQRMACRRIGALEAELIFTEDRIAKIRRQGKEPPTALLATYSSFVVQQRRLMLDLGWERAGDSKASQDEPEDLASYINSRANGHARNGHARAKQ